MGVAASPFVLSFENEASLNALPAARHFSVPAAVTGLQLSDISG